MKKRILFVDDDPNVLHGLARMLRPMRREWAMRFAQSGEEALEIMGKEAFDVIVSDMRMPGMDGAELLAHVLHLYPDMVRVVMSGHSGQELILKSVTTAHQYLSKPCDGETLKSTVSRAFAVRDLLTDASLKQVISQMDSLPTLPSLHTEIMAELQAPDPSIQKVGDIISQDLACLFHESFLNLGFSDSTVLSLG